MTDLLEESLLVLRCQMGDEAAFTELVDRYHLRLTFFVRKIWGQDDGVDDLLQEIWLDVFRALSKLREADAFRVWLYRLARDRVYRVLRRQSQKWVPLQDYDLVDTDAEQDAFRAEDAERIHEALQLLSPEHAEVLTLRFLEEMSYDEIARVTGQKLGTVRSRIHYAKQLLHKHLQEVCHE